MAHYTRPLDFHPPVAPGRADFAERSGGWAWPMTGLVLYVFIRFLNEIAGTDFDLLGALVFLALLAQVSLPRLLPLPLTLWTASILGAAFFPLLALLSGVVSLPEEGASYLVKHFAILFVLLSAGVLNLSPLPRTPARWWGLGSFLLILLAGLALGGEDGRVAGSFANPNNFALAAMCLVFFCDPDRDSRLLTAGLYLLVFLLVLFSGTSGAMLGVLAGVATALLHTRFAKLTGVLIGLGTLLGLALLLSLRAPLSPTLAENRLVGPLWLKIYLTHQEFEHVLAGDDVDYWVIAQEHGGGDLTSGVWRLVHWRETLRSIGESGLSRQLLGHGLGSSRQALGNLPHNDYLRYFFELGLLGASPMLLVWFIPALHLAPGARAPAVMMAVYAFSENNLDNFLVMSAFALFLVSARRDVPAPEFSV
jgi:hypothetical protein